MPKIKLNIKRPSWDSVKKAYMEINEIGNIAYRQYFDYFKSQGYSDDEADIQAIPYSTHARYNFVGGQVKSEFKRASEVYANTCALQVSYALNYGGMPLIAGRAKLTNGTKLIGKDGYKYYTGVSGIKGLLLENWKQLKPYSQINNRDFYKIFYDYRKEPFTTLADKYGNVFNQARVDEIRKENKNFFDILCALNIKGVVTMLIEGWGDAGGHTTLWNKKGFLDGTNYLNDEKVSIFVRELCFWELK